jgi:putative transposase
MAYNPETHKRSSSRLKTFDYTSNAAYFITVCTFQREHLFGQIVDGEMQLNNLGQVVLEEWERTAEIRPEMTLDTFIIMPDHIHAIIWISQSNASNEREPDAVGAHGGAPLRTRTRSLVRPPRSLGSFVAGFKSAATKRINESRGLPGTPVWQRNYWDRVIRDDRELEETRKYILENPRRSFKKLAFERLAS